MTKLIHHPFGNTRLGTVINDLLNDTGVSHFKAAIAFVKLSGVKQIETALEDFTARSEVDMVVGIDQNGTSFEGLQRLLEICGDSDSISIYHNEREHTFHPKLYLFKKDTSAILIIGSGNLTEGGLFTNNEAFLELCLDYQSSDDAKLLAEVEDLLDGLKTNPDLCKPLTKELLDRLLDAGYVCTEFMLNEKRKTERINTKEKKKNAPIFKSTSVPKAPKTTKRKKTIPSLIGNQTGVTQNGVTTFYMTLQNTDVGVGQTSPGSSRRSPEVFIPLVARDYAPDFWGWPNLFASNAKTDDRFGVKMKIGQQIVTVNMMCWRLKRDFRLRNSDLRSAGRVNDILVLTRVTPSSGYDYDVQIIATSDPSYKSNLSLCTQSVRNSKKKWGYH